MADEEHPEFEALCAAVKALREDADLLEGDEIHAVGETNQKWQLAPTEMRQLHARATAHRRLANRLELEALALARRKKRK